MFGFLRRWYKNKLEIKLAVKEAQLDAENTLSQQTGIIYPITLTTLIGEVVELKEKLKRM